MELVFLDFSDSFFDISDKCPHVSICEPLFMEFKNFSLRFLLLLISLFIYYLAIITFFLHI
jgi:hypothetical protein